MIEILLGMVALIVVLSVLLWLSVAQTAKESARADHAEAGLDTINTANQSITKQIKKENQQYADEQKIVADRHHFGD
jgi:hypothetical protein